MSVTPNDPTAGPGWQTKPAPPPRGGVARRLAFTAAGLACLGVAIAGAVLPGVPTAMPLMVSLYCLSRSAPALERRVRRMKLLRGYLKVIEPGGVMRPAARWASLGMMWLSIGVSVLAVHGRVPDAVVAAIVLAGGVGSVAILRFRRQAATGDHRNAAADATPLDRDPAAGRAVAEPSEGGERGLARLPPVRSLRSEAA